MTTATKKKMAVKKAAPKKAVKKLGHDDPLFLPTEFNATDQQLAKLKTRFNPGNIPKAAAKGDEGYLQIHEACMDITKARTHVEKRRKELTGDAVKWQKKVNSEARRVTGILQEMEEPWRKIKSDLDEAEKRAAEEAARVEAERQEKIQGLVRNIQSLTEGLLGASSEALRERLAEAQALEIAPDIYEEFVDAAKFHRDAAINTLTSAIAERQEFEARKAEQDRIAAEQAEAKAELDRQAEAQRKEQAERQAELDRQQKEIDDAKAEQERKDREAQEAEERKRQAEEAERQAEREKTKQVEAERELRARLPEDLKLREWADDVLAVMGAGYPDIKDKTLMNVATTFSSAVAAARIELRRATQEVK